MFLDCCSIGKPPGFSEEFRVGEELGERSEEFGAPSGTFVTVLSFYHS